jgi:RimJ/RimL family protein N-acetyltransferase
MPQLTEVTDELRPRVLRLAPHPEQQRFSGRASDTLALAANPLRRAVAALDDDGEPVAFMILDTGASMVAVHRPGTVGVRGFYVDARHQGRGIGTAVLRALPAYVREHYPEADRIALTVNVANPSAQRAYFRAGFVDTGERYSAVPSAPQLVLEYRL